MNRNINQTKKDEAENRWE